MDQLLCKKNIPFIYLILTTAGVGTFAALDNLYWDFSGYTIWEISFMASLFNIGVAIAELPFAIYFDNYSNKRALQIGNILRIISFTIFFIDGGLYWILLGQFIAGIGYAAASGPVDALILNNVDSGQDRDQAMFLGYSKIYYLSSAVTLLSGTLGIVIYYFYPAGIWLLAALLFITAAITTGFLEDRKSKDDKIPLKEFIKGLNVVFKERTTYLLILVNSAAVGPFIVWQIKIGRESLFFLFMGFFAMKLFATLASPLLRKLPLKPLTVYGICLYNICAVVIFSLADYNPVIALLFGLHVLGQAMITIFAYGKFHARIPDNIRASATSIVSLLDSAIVLLLAPLVGYLADKVSLSAAICLSAISYSLILLYVLGIRTHLGLTQQKP